MHGESRDQQADPAKVPQILYRTVCTQVAHDIIASIYLHFDETISHNTVILKQSYNTVAR